MMLKRTSSTLPFFDDVTGSHKLAWRCTLPLSTFAPFTTRFHPAQCKISAWSALAYLLHILLFGRHWIKSVLQNFDATGSPSALYSCGETLHCVQKGVKGSRARYCLCCNGSSGCVSGRATAGHGDSHCQPQ